MSNVKATLYIIGFFSLLIMSAIGASVFVLHSKQVAQGTLNNGINQENLLSEQDKL